MFTLRILFSGLVVFARRRSGKDVVGLHAFLIDARNPGGGYPRHIAALKFRTSDLPVTEQSLEFVDRSKPVQVFPLAGHDIMIEETNGSPVPVPLAPHGGRRPGSRRPEHALERSDFTWVPDMRNLYLGTGVSVDPECIAASDPSAAGLVGRMALKFGTVRTEFGAVTSEVFTFRPVNEPNSSGRWQQAMATCTAYERAILPPDPKTEPTVVLRCSSSGGSTTIRLKPALGSTVDVCLENMPIEADLDRKYLTENGDLVDKDYELVYRIANPVPDELLVPTLSTSGGLGREATRARPCGSAIFNDVHA